ncbi:MAG: hypothetical protein OEM66_01190 [Acidimicrobiia bacterium]|nr:hypothetical protein [Acidimicrobiia bacterium]
MRKVLLVAVIAALSGCATAAENLAENAIENAIENDLGGDASVSVDDDSIQITSDDGSIAMGEGADLPEGFPLPVPDGGTVFYSATDASAMVVMLEYPASMLEELIETYEDYFAGKDDVQKVEMSNPTMYIWNTSDGKESVTVADNDDGTIQVQMVSSS